MQNLIKQELSKLDPEFLTVEDESHLHQKGEQTHFKVTLVSPHFVDLSSVKRHQLIYGVLKDVIPQIHALAIAAFTPNEWQQKPQIQTSPNCLGGGLLG